MSIILSHSGKQHSYQVALNMHELGLLDTFYTSSYVRSKFLQKFFVNTHNDYFTRRFINGLSGNKIDSNWRFEFKEILFRKMFGNSKSTQNAVYQRDVNFDAYVAKQIERSARQDDNLRSNIFWGFQGSCCESLKISKRLGKLTICEQSAVHLTTFKSILEEEKELLPNWASTIDMVEMPKFYEERLLEEVNIADRVVVASEFSKKSVQNAGIDESKIIKLPLGFDGSSILVKPQTSYDNDKEVLKCLFVGSITQAKGVYYLLESVKRLNDSNIKLTLIGSLHGDTKCLAPYEHLFEYIPRVSMSELFKMYKDYDVLVHPSLTEGFGLVILEAMAAGLPVITTPHTIGSEIIANGKNGYLVPIRDIKAIQERILDLKTKKISGNLWDMGTTARASAKEFTWDSYSKRFQEVIQTELFNNNIIEN